MRSRVVVVIAAVVVPLAVLGVVISRDGGAHRPARLPILAGGSGGATTVGAARPDAALYPYGGVVYKAGAGLPELSGSAHAYRIPAVDAGAVRRLADALGFTGIAPDATNTFVKGDEQLSIATSGAWGYVRQSSGGSGVSSSGLAVACAPDLPCPIPPTTVPEHPADLPSEADARQAALVLLSNAGIDTKNADVNVDDAITQWLVRVDPNVDGFATEGLTTSVTIGEKGVVEYANGVLGTPVRADEYPLLGTTAAIERLNKGEGFIGVRPLAVTSDAVANQTAPAGPQTTIPASGGSTGASGAPASEPGSIASGEPPPLPPCDGSGAPTTRACSGSTSPPAPPASDAPGTVPPGTDTIPPAPPPQEVTISGAQQILLFAASYTGDEGWLVPAYRFSTDQGLGPTVLAIDDAFLTPPDAVPVPKGSEGSGGGSAPGDPGQPVPVEPSPAPAQTIEGSGNNG